MNRLLFVTPFNTKRQFVMATAPGGCKVYLPVDSCDSDEQIKKRDSLQNILDEQCFIESGPSAA